jgi:dipeptide/tripeptide permease
MTLRGAERATQSGDRLALSLILIVQAVERTAWTGLTPQLPELARSLGASEGGAAFWLSLFILLTYIAAYPLAPVADRYLRPRSWCGLGLLSLAVGYGLLGSRWLLAAALLLPIGLASFRLGIGLAVAGLDKTQPAWWLIYLAANIGGVIGGWSAQQIAWTWGLPAVCRACAVIALAGGILCVFIRGARPASAVKAPSARCMVGARWWAVRCICLLSVGAWVAALQPTTTMILFTGRTSPWLGPLRLGVGSYVALHSAQVIVVVLIALVLRRTATSVMASVWALLSTAAGFAVVASAALGSDLRSPLWLVCAYALLAIAEPFLFVAGVGSVGRLAPAGYEGRAFGAWYGSIGLSMFGASLLGLCWDRISASSYFALIALAMIANAALMARVAGRLDALLKRFSRDVPARSASASPQRTPNERMDAMTEVLATPSDSPPSESLFPAVQPGRWALVLASAPILLPWPIIIMQSLPLHVRALSAIFCGLAVLLGGPYLVARLMIRLGRPATARDC